MNPSGSLNEMDAARSPDSCNNCDRQNICKVKEAHDVFQRTMYKSSIGKAQYIDIVKQIAPKCDHFLRGEDQ